MEKKTKTVKAKDQVEQTKLDDESKAVIGGFFQQLAILTNRINELEKEIDKLKHPLKYLPNSNLL